MTTLLDRLHANIGAVFLGNPGAIDRVMTCLLARGHVLIEDVPGVGKTILATALARSIDCRFARAQLTPDLLPTDLLGVSIYNQQSGQFDFKPGPIFTNIFLADEINRASPRTQSALLEAMSEGAVSTDGITRRLDQPFMVVATQNPHEFEGTFPLPENQLDRFLMRIHLGYPSPEAEARVLDLRPATGRLHEMSPVINAAEVLELQQRTDGVRIEQSLVDYIVTLATSTRQHDDLRIGVSPRGALALAQAARATAVLSGRDYCVPEDITTNILPVCAHRVVTKSHLYNGEGATAERVLEEVVERVAVPG
ncbi:MAG: MoxR family ATPase [Phycisphaeraceae bacterium]|nr:MoxR family ATPase [Phycisphaeraceae bacterium]MCB9847992.1 MoxR family ATPase [Phycisphaeraceae bacterium]